METHTFTLLLDGSSLDDDTVLDALYNGGCNDATFGVQDSVAFADFDREAASWTEALVSAVSDIERAVPGMTVLAAEPQDIVSAADIAKRTNRSRANISQLIDGSRGPGDFPRPVPQLSIRRPVWRWAKVLEWFEIRLQQPVGTCTEARSLGAVNAMLDLRRHSARLTDLDSCRILDWVNARMTGSPIASGPVERHLQAQPSK